MNNEISLSVNLAFVNSIRFLLLLQELFQTVNQRDDAPADAAWGHKQRYTTGSRGWAAHVTWFIWNIYLFLQIWVTQSQSRWLQQNNSCLVWSDTHCPVLSVLLSSDQLFLWARFYCCCLYCVNFEMLLDQMAKAEREAHHSYFPITNRVITAVSVSCCSSKQMNRLMSRAMIYNVVTHWRPVSLKVKIQKGVWLLANSRKTKAASHLFGPFSNNAQCILLYCAVTVNRIVYNSKCFLLPNFYICFYVCWF